MMYKRKVFTNSSEESDQFHESSRSRKVKRFGFEHWHIISLLLLAYDILSVNGEIWIIETKGGFDRSGTSHDMDIYTPKKFVVLSASREISGI